MSIRARDHPPRLSMRRRPPHRPFQTIRELSPAGGWCSTVNFTQPISVQTILTLGSAQTKASCRGRISGEPTFSDRPRSIRFWPKRRRNGADPAVPDGAVEGDGGAGRRWDRARRSSSRFEGRAPSPRSVRRRQRALSPEMAPARTPVLGRIGLARTATVLASGSAQRPGTWGELRHTGP
jgi:hypothetical protein